jgi:hypothetical protein
MIYKIVLGVFIMVQGTMALPAHTVSTQNIAIGTPFTYSIAVPINFPYQLTPSFGVFEHIKTTVKEQRNAKIFHYRLQSFSLDNTVIPTQSITGVNGLPPSILRSIPLQVRSILTSNQMNDIAPIINILYVPWAWVWICLGCLVLAGLGIYGRKYYKQRIRQRTEPLVVEHPGKRAMAALKSLSSSVTNDPRVIHNGYIELTDIMCQFIASMTDINVVDATTEEMKQMLKNVPKLNTEHYDNIMQLADEMDHYKFSENPELKKETIQQNIQKVVGIVKGMATNAP